MNFCFDTRLRVGGALVSDAVLDRPRDRGSCSAGCRRRRRTCRRRARRACRSCACALALLGRPLRRPDADEVDRAVARPWSCRRACRPRASRGTRRRAACCCRAPAGRRARLPLTAMLASGTGLPPRLRNMPESWPFCLGDLEPVDAIGVLAGAGQVPAAEEALILRRGGGQQDVDEDCGGDDRE